MEERQRVGDNGRGDAESDERAGRACARRDVDDRVVDDLDDLVPADDLDDLVPADDLDDLDDLVPADDLTARDDRADANGRTAASAVDTRAGRNCADDRADTGA
jgi:hypothetical protein